MNADQLCEEIIRRGLQCTTLEEILQLKTQVISENHIDPPPMSKLRVAYTNLVARGEIPENKFFLSLLKKRAVRTQSGVAIITVLTKPYPCPGTCTYCPTEVRMPKSYIETEPAAQRALVYEFDPFAQVFGRLTTLAANGHPTDKIELIVKGGTWSAYRWDYQLWFIRRCFDACNAFGAAEAAAQDEHTIRKEHASGTFAFNDTPEMRTHDAINNFITIELARLEEAQTKNETAGCRIIGMTLETRPDWIRPNTLWQLRTLGCTRVELGLQHTDNEILAYVKRGHTIEQTMEAMRLLRHAGFKVDVHTMPQLPGATPEKDYQMFVQLFADERLRPDMIKIYPCVVTPTAEIAEWFARGEYTPYALEDLRSLLANVKAKLIPRYCRISRLIRDIPGTEIIAGNTITNLREAIQAELTATGRACLCLRCREVGHVAKHNPEIIKEFSRGKLFIEQYRASDGEEYFLSIEDPERRTVFAFARLYIPDDVQDASVKKLHELLPQTTRTAFLRELHTYGFLVPVATAAAPGDQQHRGLGKQLMMEAEKIVSSHGLPTLTVISGVGVRGFYEKIGYVRAGTYMVKSV